jgi:hypothetical protein
MPMQRIIQCCCYGLLEDQTSCPDYEKLNLLNHNKTPDICAARKGFMCQKQNPQELYGYNFGILEMRQIIEKRLKK